MLILLPPSEGKDSPSRGTPMDPSRWPSDLASPRRRMLESLVELCSGDPANARKVLGLGVSQAEEIEWNCALLKAPAARVDRIYTGVLYEALDLASLPGTARRRAARQVLITSSLYGVVSLTERIAPYRLSGDVTLPRVGKIAAFWREALAEPMQERAGTGVVLDLRSTTYAAFWRSSSPRVISVRVLHEVDGQRKVVSHFNKATKGRLVRSVLESQASPRSVEAAVSLLRDLGWVVERDGQRIDVVVTEV